MSAPARTARVASRRRAAAGALLTLGLLVLLLPGLARAGTWTLLSCRQPDGQPAPTDGWSSGAVGSLGSGSGDANSCAGGGEMSAVSSGSSPQSAYQGPEWTFTAPSGSTIAGGTITASLTSPHGQAWLGTPNETYDSADVLVNCQYNLPCGSGGTMAGTFPITHTGGSNLYAAAVCVGPYEGATSCPAEGGVDAAVDVQAAAIELDNDATPTASGLAGTLLAPNAQGTADLTFQASDPGGAGIYLVTVFIDGKAVYSGTPDSNEGKCVAIESGADGYVFDHAQPCRVSESVDVPVNTAALSNGTHTMKVTVQDAAQNAAVVFDGMISTLQPASSLLGALPGPGTSNLNPPEPNGIAASEAARLTLGQPDKVTRSYAKRGLRLTGRLLNPAGIPISGATLDLLERTGGRAWALLGHAQTAGDGTFTATVPAGSSRTLEVAYRAYSTDGNYAATARVIENVNAGVELIVAPRHTGPQGTITLSGRVAGPVPAQGVIVDLLVHYRGHWEPFRTPRTDSAGRFHVAYQFEGAVGRFPFRAEVPPSQANFPFARGLSEIVDVTTN